MGSHHAGQTPKRKSEDDDIYSSILSEQIKRFRISVTPGELRMRKDLHSLRSHRGFNIEFAEEPSCVTLRFSDAHMLSPLTFKINIPRFYPHDTPVITCIDSEHAHDFFDSDGYVSLRSLGINWTAMCSILDVLLAVQKYFASRDQNSHKISSICSSGLHTAVVDNFSVTSVP